jgi:hypothetical protein
MLLTGLYSACFYGRKATMWPLKILTEQYHGYLQFFHMYNAIDPLLVFLLLITKIILIKYKLSFFNNYIFRYIIGFVMLKSVTNECMNLLEIANCDFFASKKITENSRL